MALRVEPDGRPDPLLKAAAKLPLRPPSSTRRIEGYAHLVDDLGMTDFQINTPFPGGSDNAVNQSQSELLLSSTARRQFAERPIKLM